MFKIVLLAVMAAGTRAMILCPPNACASMDCAPTDGCNGRVAEGAGWCGCCDICMTQLAEGDNCMATMLLGVPATAECGEGLYCNTVTMKCTKKPLVDGEAADTVQMAPCLRKKQEIELSRANDLPLIGVSDPMCDADGYYAAVQCFGSVCNCYDRNGNMLEGYSSDIGTIADMDCKCALDQATYMATGMVGKMFYCASNGNYKVPPTPTTVAPPTVKPLLTGSQLGSGSGSQLGTATGTLTATNGACANELQTAQGSGLLGTFIPECDADGNYIPRQCLGSECYCVRKDGTKIEGYSAPIETKDHVTCQCARDKDTYQTLGLLGRIHTCRQNGNYQQYQCLGSVCYCTDDLGNKLNDQSVSIGNINDLNCA